MRIRSILLLIITAFLWTACDGTDTFETPAPEPVSEDPITDPTTDPNTDPTSDPGEPGTLQFTEATVPVVNPERGFYGGAVDIFSASSPVSVAKARALRQEGLSLIYIGFYLTDFMNGDISDAYLEMIQQSMDALRTAGIKCVLRFGYQNRKGNEPWDAPVDVVLRHVEQLKPVLQKNEDVIFILQAGFVGVWGEWYYTTHFNYKPTSDADFEPRRQLTAALLDALPVSRQIALRTPEFKMRMYRLSVKDTLTATTAHDGSDLSRLAGHNDCFGAAEDDWGTFDNVDDDRTYWKADSRYWIMGGETCNLSDYCTCKASLKDMQDYHWTYLNSGYNDDVLNHWKKSGCYNEIRDRLGYRLVLEEGTYSIDGQTLSLELKLKNKGFAAPMNPRNAEFVFVAGSGEKTRFPLEADPRSWQPGAHTIQLECTLPAPTGTLYLALEDPLLPDRPEYSIAFANKDVFDAKTGWNKLLELK